VDPVEKVKADPRTYGKGANGGGVGGCLPCDRCALLDSIRASTPGLGDFKVDVNAYHFERHLRT